MSEYFWRKLNYLVPEPQCRTRDGAILEWSDARPQPTDTEINAIDIADVDAADAAAQEASELANFNHEGVLLTIAKGFHELENRVRVLEGRPAVTLQQVIQALKAL
jgi:hypothetical protein